MEVSPMRVRGQTPTVRPDVWADRLTSQVAQCLRERAISWERHNLTAPTVEEMLDRVIALLPPAAPDALDAEIGPFYDTASVATLLGGVSKQAVEARRKKHTILAAKTADGRWAYPTFQFTGSDVAPALVPAIQAFRHAPAWSAAAWFVTPNPDLDDATPLEWARDGRATNMLLSSAQRTAREWQ
jgi:hypothetical protein